MKAMPVYHDWTGSDDWNLLSGLQFPGALCESLLLDNDSNISICILGSTIRRAGWHVSLGKW